ncbi:MAG: CARDB domain-containing protein, partial [Candidatus Micrarchaeota archaeon]
MKFGGAVFLMFVAAAFAPFASALPDLVVSQLWLSDSAPAVGQTITVQFTTSNIGNSSSGYAYTVINNESTNLSFFVAPLNPGQNQSNNSAFKCLYAGWQAINAFADYFGNVGESNEYNNWNMISVYCSANATPSPSPSPSPSPTP